MSALPPVATPEPTKELKVCVPIRLHTRLHAEKILNGVQISETVARAVEAYFRALDAATAEPR